MYRQQQDLKQPFSFLIGTPGRIKDVENRNLINLNIYESVVLDEVDRMLDMGFINDIRFLLSKLPQKRQSLFFSATLSDSIADLVQTFSDNPVTVSVKIKETAQTVDQDVIRLKSDESKITVLEELLQKPEVEKVIIFGRTKRGVHRLAQQLQQKGFQAESIHGNKNQSQRERALNKFKQNEINILVATDVAARGIDVADVTHVINYDLPQTYDDYVHRIGRTGRAGNTGKALTFLGN